MRPILQNSTKYNGNVFIRVFLKSTNHGMSIMIVLCFENNLLREIQSQYNTKPCSQFVKNSIYISDTVHLTLRSRLKLRSAKL